MPLVSYAVAPGVMRGPYQSSTPQLTVPLPKYNGPPNRRATWFRPLIVAVLALPGDAAPAGAQRVTGPWEDGSIAPRGVLRIGITPRFGQWKDRHDADGHREPLGALASTDTLGASIPFVLPLRSGLSVLTGLASPPLSLGSLETKVDVTEIQTHIALDYGLTARVGLQALIPYVKNRVHVLPRITAGGTLGFNPAAGFAGARAQNGLVVGSVTAAASRLSSELTRCVGLTDPSCTAINADRNGAAALVQLAGQVSSALGTVYGTNTVSGGLYAPVAGSTLHTAVDARLTSLNTQFRAFLGAPTAGEWISGRPVPAPPFAAADLDSLLGSERTGIGGTPLGDYEHSHVGDIEIGAKLMLVDTFGAPAVSPLPRAGAMRLAVAGVYRLPTGQLDLAHNFTDVGTGDRQADLELRGFGDLAIGPRFWVSSVLRFTLQQSASLVRRIPGSPGDPFPEAAREAEVSRNPGDVMELEIAPRYVPNDEFSVSTLYRFHSKGADAHAGTFQAISADGTPLVLDAALLDAGTSRKEHLFGFSVTYSTVRAHARGSAKWPLEVSYLHTQVLGGAGVPRMQMNGIGLRFYRPVRSNPLRLPEGQR